MATYPLMKLYYFYSSSSLSDSNSALFIRNFLEERDFVEKNIQLISVTNKKDLLSKVSETMIKHDKKILCGNLGHFDCRDSIASIMMEYNRIFWILLRYFGGHQYYIIDINKEYNNNLHSYIYRIQESFDAWGRRIEICNNNGNYRIIIHSSLGLNLAHLSFYLFIINHIDPSLCSTKNDIHNTWRTSKNILDFCTKHPENILNRGNYQTDVALSLFNIYLTLSSTNFYSNSAGTIFNHESLGISNFYINLLRKKTINKHLLDDFNRYIEEYFKDSRYMDLYYNLKSFGPHKSDEDVENTIYKVCPEIIGEPNTY